MRLGLLLCLCGMPGRHEGMIQRTEALSRVRGGNVASLHTMPPSPTPHAPAGGQSVYVLSRCTPARDLWRQYAAGWEFRILVPGPLFLLHSWHSELGWEGGQR